MEEKILDSFCELILKVGVNLQENQGLEIVCPVEKYTFAQALTKKAYQMKAKIVRVRWEDDLLDRYNYEYASEQTLQNVPKWLVSQRNQLVEDNFCYVSVSAENPDAFYGLDASKIARVCAQRSKALKKYIDAVMNNQIRWCVVSVPTLDWAKKVFPNDADPVKSLSNAILKACRLDIDQPLKAWDEHLNALKNRAKYLNDKNYEYLHFVSSIGTDLKIGLADGHLWTSALEKAKDGVEFCANLPTEEVFTAPHKNKADGIVKSALPLVYNGQVIDGITLKFKNGKIVSHSALTGESTLTGLINTDAGTRRLGEVALIGKSSPIRQTGILFYNTLFDENASCHLAIGKAYPTTVNGGDKMNKSQLSAIGVNDSVEHVDFMIGTDDLTVYGIDRKGNKDLIFKNGEWAI